MFVPSRLINNIKIKDNVTKKAIKAVRANKSKLKSKIEITTISKDKTRIEISFFESTADKASIISKQESHVRIILKKNILKRIINQVI